jgi:hypothetical protein
MAHITVRRYQADADRSVNDFDLHSEDLRQLARSLREVLGEAQARRGVGLWSDADPEIWMGHIFVGRLGPEGDIAELTRLAMAELTSSLAAAIVEAIDVVVGRPPSLPLSLRVTAGEIVGLLFPHAHPRAPTLRALAGLDAAVSGEVRILDRARVLFASSARSLSGVLSDRPDLVVLDAAGDVADRNLWALLASERALGTSFVVATSTIDQACRCDRVSLASWEMGELPRAITELVRRMRTRTAEFLAVMGQPRRYPTELLALEMRRFNVGARALLTEMQHGARTPSEFLAFHEAAAHVAGATVEDCVLDAVIVEMRDS